LTDGHIRNTNYWDTQSRGNVTKFVLTPIKENATRVAALLSGDVDFISPVPPRISAALKETENSNWFSSTAAASLRSR